MATVLVHIHNEEYLLPHWLRHHRCLFEAGVVVDQGSTDRSLEICHDLVPDWQIVPSRLASFDAALTDSEMMVYEWGSPGWKLVLNATEFLLATPESLRDVCSAMESAGVLGSWLRVKTMVDDSPDDPVEADLLAKKDKGFLYADVPTWALKIARRRWREPVEEKFLRRLLHRSPTGCYRPGRHATNLPIIDGFLDPQGPQIRKYAFSPWTEEMISRKIQIGPRVPATDITRNLGSQHLRSREALDLSYRRHLLLMRAANGTASRSDLMSDRRLLGRRRPPEM